MKVDNSASQEEKVSSNSVVDNYLSARGRERCYEARDRYFMCLDKVEGRTGKQQVPNGGVECVEEYQQYTNNCLSSWVRYFNQQRKVAKSKPKDFIPKQNS
ncbi:hypothetical protein GpartN1_g1174.t1 [Galdieria partita]|uniref:Uncharacterized protein n=1 Tax=Galdieria partita TaxID=83374 RepID=A0A9C7UN39_9RHOD|nr:hypothetical protein GpartN1_g1174.t1 [Galdieria partita]